MSLALLASYLVPTLAAVGVILGYFRFKPGEREQTALKVDKGYFEVAQGSFITVTKEMEDQFQRMSAELRAVRDDLDAVRQELRRVKAERDDLKSDNEACNRQIATLNARVEELERHL